MKIKNHKINCIENMIINILEEGEKEVWKSIEKVKNPFKRIEQRKIFNLVKSKI